MDAPVIALCAGEASGDKLAAALVRDVRARLPRAVFYGVGGEGMAAAGVEMVADCAPLAVMGYVDVAARLPAILRVRGRFLRRCAARPPDVFVGVDVPDFNLPLARRLRGGGAVCVQYVAPSVWMWRRERLAKIRAAVDAVLCLLPFEEQVFARAGIAARFVGHPAAGRALPTRAAARGRLGLGGEGGRTVAFLPGSRAAELARHLPLLRAVAGGGELGDCRVAAVAADARAAAVIRAALPQAVLGELDDVLAAADAALVKSGTVALEAALAGVPMAVFYRPSRVAAWAVRRRRFYLPFFSLPNIMCGRFVTAELVGEEATVANLTRELRRLLEDEARCEGQRVAFARVREALRGGEGAAGEVVAGLAAARCAASAPGG